VALNRANITASTVILVASAIRTHLFGISETRNFVQENNLKHNN